MIDRSVGNGKGDVGLGGNLEVPEPVESKNEGSGGGRKPRIVRWLFEYVLRSMQNDTVDVHPKYVREKRIAYMLCDPQRLPDDFPTDGALKHKLSYIRKKS